MVYLYAERVAGVKVLIGNVEQVVGGADAVVACHVAVVVGNVAANGVFAGKTAWKDGALHYDYKLLVWVVLRGSYAQRESVGALLLWRNVESECIAAVPRTFLYGFIVVVGC